MPWTDRVNPVIKLISPDGDVFEAYWSGNPRTKEKRLGVFTNPMANGATVQDLGMGPDQYPLTIFFEGPEHDIESERFFNSCNQFDTWSIIHPTKGSLNLQLVSVSEDIQPVTSGNITQFDTNWIKPREDTAVTSTTELAALINDQAATANESALDELERNAKQATASERFSIITTVNKAIESVKKTLSVLYETTAELNARALSIQRGIQDTISQPVIDVLGLGGQIQNLVQLPLLATTDINTRINIYSDMIDNMFDLFPDGDSTSDLNKVTISEVFLSAAVVANAQISATGLLQTRAQAVEVSESITDKFLEVVSELETIQHGFSFVDIDVQYFSQTLSFNQLYSITMQSAAYLFETLFDLKIEKKFTLTRPKTPIGITIEEYGDLGENDYKYDLFLESNVLKYTDILLLPAGREVVVYV